MNLDLPEGGTVLEGWGEPEPVVDDPTIGMRIYAVARWSADIAITELRDGTEHALIIRDAGPDVYLPSVRDWGRINDTTKMGINYVLTGSVDGTPPRSTDYAKVFEGEDGRWYYRIYAANHEMVDSATQGYATKANAVRAARRGRADIEIKES